MKKHLTAIGNSLGLIIEKPILDLLKIDRETSLEVTTDGHGLYIKPVGGDFGCRLHDKPKQTIDLPPDVLSDLSDR